MTLNSAIALLESLLLEAGASFVVDLRRAKAEELLQVLKAQSGDKVAPKQAKG